MSELLGVVVGGVIALGGGVATQLVSYRLQRQTELRKIKETKFEELVPAIYEFEHWLDQKRLREVYGEDRPETIAPWGKIFLIIAVYFAQLYPTMLKVRSAASNYEVWISQQKQN
jgi:hypothetical protein